MRIARRTPLRSLRSSERGFTMIVTIIVLFITGLMLVAAFAIANDEIFNTKKDTERKEAYYAALAGVQEYEYKLQANPDYWQTCEAPKSTVPEGNGASYEVTVLPASTAPTGTTACQASNPFKTVLQSEGELADTFRIKSVGTDGKATRSLIATFRSTGFLDFVYFTNFETEDPDLYNAPAGCAGKYYSEWNGKYACEVITFSSVDSVEGPLHTNDAARVQGSAEFGRKGHKPADSVEIYGGTYPEDTGEKCTGEPIFWTATKCYTKGEKLEMPEGDTTLEAYVEEANEFTGETRLELNGTTNTIKVVNLDNGEETTETINWPKNGLIYVTSSGCGWPHSGGSWRPKRRAWGVDG